MTCACGLPLPDISLYGVMHHVCERCGRERHLIGAGVHVKVPPGAERFEELERRVAALARDLAEVCDGLGIAMRKP